MLKECLADVEARIDVETEERLISEWKEFLNGEFSGELFSPTRGEGNKPKIDWPSVSVNDGLSAKRQAAEAALASGRDLHHMVNAWTW